MLTFSLAQPTGIPKFLDGWWTSIVFILFNHRLGRDKCLEFPCTIICFLMLEDIDSGMSLLSTHCQILYFTTHYYTLTPSMIVASFTWLIGNGVDLGLLYVIPERVDWMGSAGCGIR